MNSWDLQVVAKRVLWFKKPGDALQETKVFLAHVMTCGTLSDAAYILETENRVVSLPSNV